MPDAAPPSAVREAPARPRGDFKQGLRVRRFLFASAFSMMYLAVLAGFYLYDKVDRTTLLQACALVAAFIAAFYCVFRFGLNLRLPRSEPHRMAVSRVRLHHDVHRLSCAGDAPRLHLLLLRRADVLHAASQRPESRRPRRDHAARFRARGLASLSQQRRRRDAARGRASDDRDGRDASLVPVRRRARQAASTRPERDQHQTGGSRGKGAPRRSHRRLQPACADDCDGRGRSAGRMSPASRCRSA